MPMSRRTLLAATVAAMASVAVHARAPSYAVPKIIGRTWTPDRDDTGKIEARNWQHLPINTWLLVGTGVLNDVIELPHLTTVGGYDSAPSIMANWSGAVYDPATKRSYIMGGGHSASDECETGIYCCDTRSLTYSRVQDRAPTVLRLSWNNTTNVLESVPRGHPYNTPLADGRPGAVHSRYHINFLPSSFMGNVSGGIWMGGYAKGRFDFDSKTYDTCHWWNPRHSDRLDIPWAGIATIFDGESIYCFHEEHYISRYALRETQPTDWSQASSQKLYRRAFKMAPKFAGGKEAGTFCEMRELRQCMALSPILGHRRIRHGQAIDSGATNWTPYSDAITLTSNEGSHNDFIKANFTYATNSPMQCAGCVYDAAADCLWFQRNEVGGHLYRIDGISAGNTWVTTKIPGTGAIREGINHTYGRMYLATMAGSKILVRMTTIYHPIQVMRIS